MLFRASMDVDGVAQMWHMIRTVAFCCSEQTENFKRRFLAATCCACSQGLSVCRSHLIWDVESKSRIKRKVKWVWCDGIITPSPLRKEWWYLWQMWYTTVRCHMAMDGHLSTGYKYGQKHCNWSLIFSFLPLQLFSSGTFGWIHHRVDVEHVHRCFPKG